jgi:hypothetical protein
MPLSVLLFAAFLQTIVGTVSDAPQLKAPESVTAEKDKCTVSGIVSSMQTGEPVKKVTLHLTLQSVSRPRNGVFEQTGYSGTSGPDGSFKFEGVEPGEYSLSGEKSGFVHTSYGSKNGLSGGSTLSLSPGQQMAGVKMQLVAQATITGHVLDDDGDPVGGVSVQALGRMWAQGGKARFFPRGNANTDDKGAFRIANLTPGKYYLVAQTERNHSMGMTEKPATPGKPNPQPVRTFYPSSLDRMGASAIDLKAGQEMPGADIRLRSMETFHIRGKLLGDTNENVNQPTMLMLMPEGDENGGAFMFNGMTMVKKDHTFDIANVTPGAYVITTANMNGKKGSVHQAVEVGSGDLNDMVLTVQPTFTIHGSVELEGTPSGDAKDKTLENIYVTIVSDDASVMFGRSQGMTKADGTFTLENLMPGKVRVQVFNEPDGAYLKSIRLGSQETLGKTLDLTQAGGGEIHVTLRAGAAEVSGTVTKKEGDNAATTPVSGASLLLIPEDLTRNGGIVHNNSTKQNGTFTSKGLTPGVYYAVAFESEEYRSYDDPAILRQLIDKGVKVEVKENDKQQAQITLLPAAELQAALVAAGVEN